MLNLMSEWFHVTYLCDVSEQALKHCAGRVAGDRRPLLTTKAEELCASPDVDAVVVCNATAYHPHHAALALKHDKHVFIEKPVALSYRDLDMIEAAAAKSTGSIFVGYMRRYAPAFLQAIAEVGDASKIQYARVRDIIGPNSSFVDQSGTFPKKFSDFKQEDTDEMKALDEDTNIQALVHEFGVPLNDETRRMLMILGGLGSHDLSAMREAIGMPLSVIGADLRVPVWTALLKYENFSVVYESGINAVPTFDAHIEIYTADKIVRINYDTPYVKGLPTTITIREKVEGTAAYQERIVRPTYEDSYTVEFREWYECITQGRTAKTSTEDARKDLDIFKMLMQASFKK
jgi:predicted dehydrogenase